MPGRYPSWSWIDTDILQSKNAPAHFAHYMGILTQNYKNDFFHMSVQWKIAFLLLQMRRAKKLAPQISAFLFSHPSRPSFSWSSSSLSLSLSLSHTHSVLSRLIFFTRSRERKRKEREKEERERRESDSVAFPLSHLTLQKPTYRISLTKQQISSILYPTQQVKKIHNHSTQQVHQFDATQTIPVAHLRQ